ncbi:MAG: type 2 lantipeptide synthetase LanM [Gemmataceae bacterium]|nr:type 2 lantipeptide synthetase LanM [Gemmataceae bacterium]
MNDFAIEIVARSASPAEAVGWSPAATDHEAQRLLERWEQRLLLDHPDGTVFEKRLSALGLDRTTALLHLTPRRMPEGTPLPSWAPLLGDVLNPHRQDRSEVARETLLEPPPLLPDQGTTESPKFPVLPELVRPFLSVVLDQLDKHATVQRWLAPSAVDDVLRFAGWRLSAMAGRTLAYELKRHARRGELIGNSSEERYRDFMHRFAGDRDWQRNLYRSYPVLARIMALRCQQTVAVCVELLERLDRDAVRLAEHFNNGRELGTVERLRAGLSDPHNGGRTVCILHFHNGLRLVYKPRSLRADARFGALVDWWNRLDAGPDLKPVRVMEGEQYGWAEFISAAACGARSDVAEYFRRQGVYLALFRFLQGADFHGDNFIAHGAYPVPVDLEGLLAGASSRPPEQSRDVPPCLAPLDDALFSSCMLPVWKVREPDQICAITSALTASVGRDETQLAPVWTGIGTDQLGLRMERRAVDEGQSLPQLDGRRIGLEAFLAELIDGFSRGHHALTAHRDSPLRELLDGFRNVDGRFVLRATAEYAFLLNWSTAPDHLVSGPAHDVAFEMLCKYACGLSDGLDLVDIEKRALWQRDVPYFQGAPTSRQLRDAAGNPIPIKLPRPCWEQMEHTLTRASERSCPFCAQGRAA